MIVVRLKSGMGNQMFQYVMGVKLAKLLNTDVVFDLSALLDRSRGEDFTYRSYDLDIFDLTIKTTHSRKILELLAKLKSNSVTKFFRERVKKGKDYIVESGFHFQSEIIDHPTDNAVYEGWFQSYRYLDGIAKLIRVAFKFKYPLIPQSQELAKTIQGSNSVCLNVRRTDFVANANLNATNLTYFARASEYIAAKIKEPVFFVFSDDIEWCKENIKLDYPMQIVDHSHKGYKFGNYMQLMTLCHHFIIPNSSFAWWSAWLSENDEKIVVAPENWFNDKTINTDDLLPTHWVQL